MPDGYESGCYAMVSSLVSIIVDGITCYDILLVLQLCHIQVGI